MTLLRSRDGKQEFKLVERVSAKWRKLGVMIGLTPNNLDAIRDDRRSVEACWEDVMQRWLDGQGQKSYPIMWEGLYRLLKDIACPQVAKELKAAVKAA